MNRNVPSVPATRPHRLVRPAPAAFAMPSRAAVTVSRPATQADAQGRARPCVAIRTGLAATAVASASVLAGCGSPAPLHDVRVYRLPLQNEARLPTLPAAEDDPLARAAWRLQKPLGWPAYLDDDRLLLPRGNGQLLAMNDYRWAEPLRGAVERLLLADLQDLRGAGRIDSAALPATGGGKRLPLQVQVLEMDTAPDQRSLRLSARWRLGPSTEGTIIECSRSLQVPVAAPTPEAVVMAHRAVIDRLAWVVAATRARGCAELTAPGA